jgi:membrane protease YdiL (CAAX protease family)
MDASVPSRSDTFRRVFYNDREVRAGWRLLIFLLIVISLTAVANRLIALTLAGASNDVLSVVRLPEDFLIALLVSWLMGRYEKRTIADYGLPWRRMFRARFWSGAAAGFVSASVLMVGLRAFGLYHFPGVALHGSAVWKWGVGWALLFLLVGLREEFRARGYLLYTLTAGIGFWPAAVISSIFFGYSHHLNTGEDWIGLFNAGAFGLLQCFLLRRTGDLWLPIGLHAAFDWAETYFYGVADSGQVLPGHLLNSTYSGPAWLSGGTVGPEGSVLATLLIIGMWLVARLWLRETKYPSSAAATA